MEQAGAAVNRRRHRRVVRQHDLVDAPVVGVFLGVAPRRDHHAVVGRLDDPLRGLVERLVAVLALSFGRIAQVAQTLVEKADVTGVDVALHGLHPVAFDVEAVHVAIAVGTRIHSMSGTSGCMSLGTQIDPDHAGRLTGWIGVGANAIFEDGLGRLVGHVQAGAVDVELPAVVDAAQAAVFVAAVNQRRLAVRTQRLQHADAARRCRGTRPGPHQTGALPEASPSGSGRSDESMSGVQNRRT